ncbi:MAG: uroporphyrinogen decarboxylase family protein [Actinomycetota bacterium]|nr:uroporphyrinogen decarboxylase family protein [Actinomycetota bacterium]
MVAPLARYPGLRVIGRSLQKGLQDAGIQLEALRALEEKLRPDVIFTCLDSTVEAEALGLEVEFYNRNPAALNYHEHLRPSDITQMDLPDPESSGRMPLFLEVADGLCKGKDRSTVPSLPVPSRCWPSFWGRSSCSPW